MIATHMIITIYQRFGPYRMAAITTLVSALLSVLLYFVISLILGKIQLRGIITAALIPTIVAPPICLLFFNALFKLDVAEKALKESESLYRQVFEQVRDAIYVLDPEGRVSDINPAGSAILGYTRNEFKGMVPHDFLVDPSQLKRQLKIFKEIGYFIDDEIEFFHKDGRVLTCLETSSPWYDENGKLIGYIGTLRDITEKKKADEELKNLRILLSGIVDSMPSCIIGLDPENRITHWNRHAAQLFGKSAEEAVGGRLDQFVDQPAGLAEMVENAIKDNEAQVKEKIACDQDGKAGFCDITVYPLLHENLHGVVIRIDNATARVKMEELIIQTEKMISVGGLAAGMAHEINNPLGGIITGAQNAMRRISPEFKPNIKAADELGTDIHTIREYLEQRQVVSFMEGIVKNGRRASQIVSNMLEFSRPAPAVPTPTTPNDIFERALELTANHYGPDLSNSFKSIEIVKDFMPDAPTFPCAATSIEQVVLNLLQNAAQAINQKVYEDEKPRITLRTGMEDNHVFLEVEDNGPGMDEATRKRVFEPFYTTKPPGLGTGLGLSVSYFIVSETHKGAIAVDSQPGSGTRFKVALPIEGATTDCTDSRLLELAEKSINARLGS